MKNIIYFAVTLLLVFSCASSKPKIEANPEEITALESDTPPVQLYQATPYFPTEAIEKNITGVVWLEVLIDEKGKVQDVIPLPDEGENTQIFEKSAIEAAHENKWKPAKMNGKPVAAWVKYRINYNLK
jgi:TonB family protein